MFVVLLGVYGTECAAMVPPGSVVFSAPWLRRWRLASPWNVLAGLGKALAFGNPIPPLGMLLACRPGSATRSGFSVAPSFDAGAVTRRVEEYRGATRGLRVACNLLCVYLFVAVPAVAVRLGLVLTWPYLLAGLFALMAVVSYLMVSTGLGNTDKTARWQQAMLAALVPTTSIRACDTAAAALLDGIHPLAAAKALCAPEDFSGYARLFYYDLTRADGEAAGRETAAWSRPEWRDAIERFLEGAGATRDVLLRPPAPVEKSSKTYCPRCHAEFTLDAGTCKDCGGIPLTPF
ncbi:MAG: hypothetical protein AAB368_13085 [bacterium]